MVDVLTDSSTCCGLHSWGGGEERGASVPRFKHPVSLFRIDFWRPMLPEEEGQKRRKREENVAGMALTQVR